MEGQRRVSVAFVGPAVPVGCKLEMAGGQLDVCLKPRERSRLET